jgi:hypothetical protein
MSDEQQPMQQPVELRFLEMIRELPSELPDYLVRYQSEASAELRSFEENSNRVRGLNETRTFTPEAMVILFHHIAFETFKGFEKLYEQLNDEEDDPIFSDFASPSVRHFWHTFVRARREAKQARGKALLDSFSAHDKEALESVGVRIPKQPKVKPRPARQLARE